MQDYLKTIIVAVVALLGIWADYLTGQQNTEHSIKAIIKLYIQVITTSAILIVLGFDLYKIDEDERWHNREMQVYGNIDSILTKAKRASHTLDALQNKSVNLDSRLEHFNDSFARFATNGLNYFEKLNTSAEGLANPLPRTITLECVIVSNEELPVLKNIIRKNNPYYNSLFGFIITKQMLYESNNTDYYEEPLQLIFYENQIPVLWYKGKVDVLSSDINTNLLEAHLDDCLSYDTTRNIVKRYFVTTLTLEQNFAGYTSVLQLNGKYLRLRYSSEFVSEEVEWGVISVRFDDSHFIQKSRITSKDDKDIWLHISKVTLTHTEDNVSIEDMFSFWN